MLKIPEIIDLDRKSYFQGSLLVCPTPLGNLRDLSLKAFDALMTADVIVCEDTRVTGKLFKLIRSRNMDTEIKDFSEGTPEEKSYQDDYVFDYLKSLSQIDHKNLLGIRRMRKKLKDFMQENDVEDTR